MERRTDMAKLIVVLRNFANVLKMPLFGAIAKLLEAKLKNDDEGGNAF